MPTYAYTCTACSHRFDAVQSFADDALTECPACGGRVRKNYGSIGVTFSGSGFYRTDSRSTGVGAGDQSSASSKADASTGANPAPATATASD